MFKLKKIFFLFLCLFIFSSSVNAEDAYFKVSYGISSFDLSTSVKAGTPTFDDEDEGYMISAGQKVGSNWGIDLMYYDFGSSSIKGSKSDIFIIDGAAYEFATAGTITNDITGYGLGGIGFADIGELASTYVKLGMHVWDKSGSTTLLTDGNDTFKQKFYWFY